MRDQPRRPRPSGDDRAPGDRTDDRPIRVEIRGYVVGLLLAAALTTASFWAQGTDILYGPGVPLALVALAVAQMGVHLVFFLHVTSGPDNVNNAMALAFGVFVVALVLLGSVWIMSHLHHNLMPATAAMEMGP